MKYNTNPLVFLTWYQSHYSDLFLAILSLLVWFFFFFFNIASAITTTAAAFHCWTSDVIQLSSLGSEPATAVVKEFHTTQTTTARITATNIAPITVLKLPQRSSCTDLQNRESLNAVRDCTRPHALLKVSVRLITRSTCLQALPRVVTRRHAPPRACTRQFSPADVSPRWRHLPRHLLTSSLTRPFTCVDFDRWLFFRVDFFSPGSFYPVFRVDFIFAVCFCILCL